METLERLIANHPEFSKILPMPTSFYKKYNVEPPKIVEFNQFINTVKPVATGVGELRPVAEGGVRPLLEAPEAPLEILPECEEEK